MSLGCACTTYDQLKTCFAYADAHSCAPFACWLQTCIGSADCCHSVRLALMHEACCRPSCLADVFFGPFIPSSGQRSLLQSATPEGPCEGRSASARPPPPEECPAATEAHTSRRDDDIPQPNKKANKRKQRPPKEVVQAPKEVKTFFGRRCNPKPVYKDISDDESDDELESEEDVQDDADDELELSDSDDDDDGGAGSDSDYGGAKRATRPQKGAGGTKKAAAATNRSKVQLAGTSNPRKARREAACEDLDSHVKYRGVTRKCATGPLVPALQLCYNASVSAQAMLYRRSEVCRVNGRYEACLLYTSPSPRDRTRSRMPSSA